jgi:streptogramin lyase
MQLRSYNAHIDQPKTGWDEFAINGALESGIRLYVDENHEVWSGDRSEYFGKIL